MVFSSDSNSFGSISSLVLLRAINSGSILRFFYLLVVTEQKEKGIYESGNGGTVKRYQTLLPLFETHIQAQFLLLLLCRHLSILVVFGGLPEISS